MHNNYFKFLIITLLCAWLSKCQSDSVKDIDGNVYRTINIGTQVWMAENLKTTRYCNGDLIGTTTPATLDIESESAPEYQWAYDGNESNVTTYGRLYTWYVANDSRNVCSAGWHIPSDAEWTDLTEFTALPGGARLEDGCFYDIGHIGTWWSATEAGKGFIQILTGVIVNSPGGLFRDIYHDYCYVNSYINNKNYGMSVRCLKDN